MTGAELEGFFYYTITYDDGDYGPNIQTYNIGPADLCPLIRYTFGLCARNGKPYIGDGKAYTPGSACE